MYMDLTKMKKNWKLIHAVRIYSQDIGMESGIEKCTMLVMKSGERHITNGMELPNQDKIRTLGEKKPTNTRESWRLTPSNKCKWKINSKGISQEN